MRKELCQETSRFDKKQAVRNKKQAFPVSLTLRRLASNPTLEPYVFRIRCLATLGTIALLGLAACSDVTGPTQSDFCPVTGGPGTCGSAVVSH